MTDAYNPSSEPSQFVASKLDAFMHLFSFVREPTEEDLKKLPTYGFRIIPNSEIPVPHTMGFTLNSFPNFMLTRIFPYFQYYHDFKDDSEVVLTVVYFDFYISYVIDIAQMQLASPVNIKDLQSCKDEIKGMLPIIHVADRIVEICMNQPVFPREHLKEYL